MAHSRNFSAGVGLSPAKAHSDHNSVRSAPPMHFIPQSQPPQNERQLQPSANFVNPAPSVASNASNSMWSTSLQSAKDFDPMYGSHAIVKAPTVIRNEMNRAAMYASGYGGRVRNQKPTVWASDIWSPFAAGVNNCCYAFFCIPCAIADLSSAQRWEQLSSADDWINWCCCVTPPALRHAFRIERNIRQPDMSKNSALENFYDYLSCIPPFTGFALSQLIRQVEAETRKPFQKINFVEQLGGTPLEENDEKRRMISKEGKEFISWGQVPDLRVQWSNGKPPGAVGNRP